jgi:hypothetical protein
MSYLLRKLELIQATVAMCKRLEADKLFTMYFKEEFYTKEGLKWMKHCDVQNPVGKIARGLVWEWAMRERLKRCCGCVDCPSPSPCLFRVSPLLSPHIFS